MTELVTGIDLVEQMIRVAAGEKLKIKQTDVKLNGWAVESRVYAEDPYRNFLPSIGRLDQYRPPEEDTDGGTVRNDTGVFEGAEISMYYDPMIAKLVTHAATREAAIDLQAEALDAFDIDGVEHNIPFLAALMQHPRWRKGKLSTGFIAEEYQDGFKPRAPEAGELDILAAVRRHRSSEQRAPPRDHRPDGGPEVRFAKRRVVRWPMPNGISCGGRQRQAVSCDLLDARQPPPHARVDIRLVAGRAGVARTGRRRGGRRPGARRSSMATSWLIAASAPVWVYTAREAELAALMPKKAAADTSKLLLCPMPGLVKALHVDEGQEVKAGDAWVVVEAMKMENILRAERDGVVKSDQRQGGRQPGRRRRYHGICVSSHSPGAFFLQSWPWARSRS